MYNGISTWQNSSTYIHYQHDNLDWLLRWSIIRHPPPCVSFPCFQLDGWEWFNHKGERRVLCWSSSRRQKISSIKMGLWVYTLEVKRISNIHVFINWHYAVHNSTNLCHLMEKTVKPKTCVGLCLTIPYYKILDVAFESQILEMPAQCSPQIIFAWRSVQHSVLFFFYIILPI